MELVSLLMWGMTVSILLALIKQKLLNGPMQKYYTDLTDKVAIVTGSNTGIGKETAFHLAKQNAHVIMACRDAEKAEQAINQYNSQANHNGTLTFMQLDLSDLNQIQMFAKSFKQKFNRLDILVNNAGLGFMSERRVTAQGFEYVMGTNHIGPFYLTQLLIDKLKQTKQSRVIFVASDMYLGASLDFKLFAETGESRKHYNQTIVYSNSKLANMLTALKQNSIFEEMGYDCKAVSLHPGVVRTEFMRHIKQNKIFYLFYAIGYIFWWFFSRNETQGAMTSINCCLMPFDKLKGGGYYKSSSLSVPRKHGRSIEDAVMLFDSTNSLI